MAISFATFKSRKYCMTFVPRIGVFFLRLLLLLLTDYTNSVSADVTRVVQVLNATSVTNQGCCIVCKSVLKFDNSIIRNIHIFGFFSDWLKDNMEISFTSYFVHQFRSKVEIFTCFN